MGYNMYWQGEILIDPPLGSLQIQRIVKWAAINAEDRIIQDPELDKLWAKHGWKIYTPWSPFDTIEADCITFDHEGTFAEPMGLTIFQLMRKFMIPWKKTCQGRIYWDGDETEDFGCIEIKDNEVWHCDAEIVYQRAGDDKAEKIEP